MGLRETLMSLLEEEERVYINTIRFLLQMRERYEEIKDTLTSDEKKEVENALAEDEGRVMKDLPRIQHDIEMFKKVEEGEILGFEIAYPEIYNLLPK